MTKQEWKDILKKMTPRRKRPERQKRKCQQRGGRFDIQKWISKLGIEFHTPGYQYLGPGTLLGKWLKRGNLGINRLDRIARQHEIDYGKAKNIRDKWKADEKNYKSHWLFAWQKDDDGTRDKRHH